MSPVSLDFNVNSVTNVKVTLQFEKCLDSKRNIEKAFYDDLPNNIILKEIITIENVSFKTTFIRISNGKFKFGQKSDVNSYVPA